MYCGQCGRVIEDFARYCSQCGAATENVTGRQLRRVREGKWIGGVCGGVARHFDLDVSLVRLVWVLLAIFPPLPAIIPYIVCWVVIPQDPPRPFPRNASEPVG